MVLESKRKTGFAATDDAISRIIRRQFFFVLTVGLTDSLPSDGANWLDNVCGSFGASDCPLTAMQLSICNRGCCLLHE